MSEHDHTIQSPQTLTFEPLGYLANDQSMSDTNESRPVETYANELITNIIKDASQTASKSHDKNMDNANQLNSNLHQTSIQHPSETTTTNLHQSEHPTDNGYHDENDFNNDEIQKKMNGVIHDIQSGSPSRKSIASNHLNVEQVNTSAPTIGDPSTHIHSTEGPIRSISEPVLGDNQVPHEQTSPLPIRQDESSSDIDDILGIKVVPNNKTEPLNEFIDQHSLEHENQTSHHRLDNNDEFFNTKVGTMDDNQRPTSAVKPSNLDETSQFDATSTSRAQSVTSKRSVHVTPDEPSTSGDEKRAGMSPAKLLDDGGNDTDLDNREVANIARRPSRAMSPLNRPRSPTPNDSRKMSTNLELSPSLPGEHSPIPSHDNQEKQDLTPPTAIVSPPSRRESTNIHDHQQTSQPTSATKVKSYENVVEPSTIRASSSRTHQFSVTDEQAKLITQGEQLQIPKNDLNNERLNSPPPLPTDIKSLALVNPLLGSSLVQKEQDHSRPPSETSRKSPTTSMMSNEKIINGDVLPSKSRRESNLSQQQTNNTEHKPPSRRDSQIIEHTLPISSDHRASHSQEQHHHELHDHQHVASRRTSDVPQEPTSHRDSLHDKSQTSSPRESTTTEQKPPSRKDSTSSEQHVSSKRASTISEPQKHSRQGSITDEQKATSRKGSVVAEHQHPSKPDSTVDEHRPASRRGSTHNEPKTPSRKSSTTSQQQILNKRESPLPGQQSSSQRESIHDEPKTASRKVSTTSEQHVFHKRESPLPGQQSSSRRESNHDELKIASQRNSTSSDQKSVRRKESTTSEQRVPSKHPSVTSNEQPSSRRESAANDEKTTSRKGSTVIERQHSSRRESTHDEQKVASRKSSTAAEHHVSSRKESSTTEEPISNRRESHVSDKHTTHHRQGSFDQHEQRPPSKAASRKTSVAEQQQQDDSRRESQQQASSSRRTSINQDNQLISARRSSKVHISPSQESSRRNSITKQEHTSINDKRQKSSSTADENNHHRSSFQRKSERGPKQQQQHSNLMTDETVVTPIIMDSSKARHQNGKHISTTDPSYEQTLKSNLPPVNSLLQREKPRHSETKNLPSSHVTTTSEDEQRGHWTKQITKIPSIHLSDNDSTSREDQPRPQSPNVEQIAERNPIPTPPSKATLIEKKRDGQKRKEQHRPFRRSASADSVANIPLVDDNSLDSASENTPNVERYKRRRIKPKKKDVETNTDQTFDLQRSLFDDKELTHQKPLKATKPMSDHVHSTRRRISNKEQILTTPDTIPDTDGSSVRRTVKKTKDSHQDKDPVHVNVTVVVKKFAGTTKDGAPVTTAEAVVEQKPQQYFEPIQHPPENLLASTETKDESLERRKSTEQPRLPSSEEKMLEHNDRHTQSDTEQIITDNQKKRRRPKRISRTCQTYERVFRLMEREQQQELRATSDTEKTIQTRKSQLRPRKKSPKKNLPIYLSTDSFRLEEVLPKQYHQSRRNISKSSSIARSLSPQGGKLLILRPTLPFHHTDAVNVQRVCLQYAIDLIPNENFTSAALATNRNKPSNLPMIGGSSTGMNITTSKSSTKDKASSHRSDDYIHPRRNGGAV